MHLHLKSLCKSLLKVDWKRWQDSDDEEEGKSNAWNLDGADPFRYFLLGFCWAFWKPTTQPRNSVARKMPGLGDMNFGDMGGDEYDSDDEDELEWDSWEDSWRFHVDSCWFIGNSWGFMVNSWGKSCGDWWLPYHYYLNPTTPPGTSET